MDFSYSYQNLKRDLTDVLNNLIAKQPRFISLFPMVAMATNTKHEWNENVLEGYSEAVTSNSSGTLTLTTTGAAAYFPVQSLIRVRGDAAVFKVTAVNTTNNTVSVELAAANGSSKTASDIAASDILVFVARPKQEGSTAGDDRTTITGTDYNYTQIMRRDIKLSRTSISVKNYGLENAMTRQIEYMLLDMTRELNSTALFGIRAQRSGSVNGSAGGLYAFGNVLSVSASGAVLTDKLINDAGQQILDKGGNPNAVVCNPAQCRVISQIMRDKIIVTRGETGRGPHVIEVFSDITGQPMQIFAEPEMPETDVIVCDSNGFGLSWMENSQLRDWDSTPKDFDGAQRTILGEFTFEFANGAQRICPIKGLSNASDALTALQAPKQVKVVTSADAPIITSVKSSAEAPVFTKAVTD